MSGYFDKAVTSHSKQGRYLWETLACDLLDRVLDCQTGVNLTLVFKGETVKFIEFSQQSALNLQKNHDHNCDRDSFSFRSRYYCLPVAAQS